MKHLNRILALLLALLLLLPAALADKPSPIETLGERLLEAHSAFTDASDTLNEADDAVETLEAQYARDEDNASLQDRLIDAMIRQEEAADAFVTANNALNVLQKEQERLVKDADCEEYLIEYEGKFADLMVTVALDEDMVIYALAAEVEGSERDRLVAGKDYLYRFIGLDLPLTIGNGKKDDVAPLKDAQQTSKDLVAALNSLVWSGGEEASSDRKTPEGPIIEPQDIADYLFEHGELPENFITKREAQNLGWDSSDNYVSDVAPGKSIGGDRFGNYEGLLPAKKGRQWYEADCYYTTGRRNAHRILYSNDGLVFYTDDHYESFTQMFPSK